MRAETAAITAEISSVVSIVGALDAPGSWELVRSRLMGSAWMQDCAALVAYLWPIWLRVAHDY